MYLYCAIAILIVIILYLRWEIFNKSYELSKCNKVYESKIDKLTCKVITLENLLYDKNNEISKITNNATIERNSHIEELTKLKEQFNFNVGKLGEKINKLQLEILHLESKVNVPIEILDGPQPDNPSRYVIFHSCERKVPYKTLVEVESTKVKLDKLYNKEHRIYKCRYCSNYHLSTVIPK